VTVGSPDPTEAQPGQGTWLALKRLIKSKPILVPSGVTPDGRMCQVKGPDTTSKRFIRKVKLKLYTPGIYDHSD